MSNFNAYDPNQDPALTGKASWLTGANAAYPNPLAAFNSNLYTPMDRKAAPQVKSRPAWNAGWQGPSSQVPTGNYTTPYGTASVHSGQAQRNAIYDQINSPRWNTLNQNPTSNPGPPISGGGTTTANPWQPPQWNNAGSPLPDQGSPAGGNPASPPQNAMQRWMGGNDSGGMKPLTPTTRYFWATNHIDARAPQADPSQNAGAVAPVQFNQPAGNTTPNQSQVGSGAPIQFVNSVPGHSDWVSSL